MVKKIVISFTEGRVVRDLFACENFLDLLGESFEIFLATPAEGVPYFKKEWEGLGYKVIYLKPYQSSIWEERIISQRKTHKNNKIVSQTWGLIEKLFKQETEGWNRKLKELDPALVLITNPMSHNEMHLWRAAKQNKITTLGVLRSWDNLYKGLRIHPDHLAVWNPINFKEAQEMENFPKDKLHIIGSTQFDPYFDSNTLISRQEFAQRLKLDYTRPIITLATLGTFLQQYDETYLMDWLINAKHNGDIPRDSQIICRLHPTSRLEYFNKYLQYADVRLSFIEGYVPSLGWTMNKAEVIFVANLLKHSNVVISPGSTITLETAIFDTPTIVPLFHLYQPELGKKQYNQHLSTHFKRLKELNLIPLIKEPRELGPAIYQAISDPSWYRKERQQLVNDYVFFREGKSIERLANLIRMLS